MTLPQVPTDPQLSNVAAPTGDHPPGLGSWLRWIWANALGIVTGLLAMFAVFGVSSLALALFFFRHGAATGQIAEPGQTLVFATAMLGLTGAAMGAAVGALQAWGLARRQIKVVPWIVATAAAFAVGVFLIMPTGLLASVSSAGTVVTAVLVGALVGTTQWVVLRSRVGRAWQWIPSNAIAVAVGWTLAVRVVPRRSVPEFRGSLPPLNPSDVMTGPWAEFGMATLEHIAQVLLTLIVAWVAASMLTGLVLNRLRWRSVSR